MLYFTKILFSVIQLIIDKITTAQSKMKVLLIILLNLGAFNFIAQEPGSGYALNFDGSNDVADSHAADLTAINDNFTIEFWVQPTTTRTTKTEANSGITGTSGKGQYYAVFPLQGGTNASAGVSVGTNGVSVYEHGSNYMPALLVYDVTLTGWNHIAIVYTAKQPSLYINGILVRTGLISTRPVVYPSGQIGGGNHGYFDGDIDEFRVWSTSRTETEVRDYMCKKLIGNEIGLARYLRIDDGSGTTVTDETGNQDATMTNMDASTDWVISGAALGNTSTYEYAPPQSFKALSFDGVNERIDGFDSDLTTVTNDFTIEMWVNPSGTISTTPTANGVGASGTSGQRYLVYPEHGNTTSGSGDAGAGISVGTNGILVYEHDGGYLPCLAKYTGTISGWNHIAVVYTARIPTIYLNGVAVSTGVASPSRTSVFPGARIGGQAYGFYAGEVDEVRIWRVSRSAAQLLANKDNELSGSLTDLVRYYKLNEGNGSTATDLTGTFDGTLKNMNSSNNWVVDGWLGNTLNYFSGTIYLQSLELDSLSISNISGLTQGFHIYHVDAVPNETTGVDGIGDNDHYYGVFKAGEVTATTYTATYYYDENNAWTNSKDEVDENDLALFTRSENSITTWINSSSSINTTNNTLMATAQSTEFILGATGGISLPINLVSFNATIIERVVQLNWQTALELNNEYFTIERSINIVDWEIVDIVDGAGNSSNLLDYSLIDINPLDGESYYRLKQTDYNGEYQYSQIKSVTFTAKEELKIYPNPTTGQIFIEGGNNELSNILIYNLLGENVSKHVKKTINGDSTLSIDLSKLSPGVYFIRTKTTANKVYEIIAR